MKFTSKVSDDEKRQRLHRTISRLVRIAPKPDAASNTDQRPVTVKNAKKKRQQKKSVRLVPLQPRNAAHLLNHQTHTMNHGVVAPLPNHQTQTMYPSVAAAGILPRTMTATNCFVLGNAFVPVFLQTVIVPYVVPVVQTVPIVQPVIVFQNK